MQMNEKELILRKGIYFQNIQEGFDTYPYTTVQWDAEVAMENLRRLWKENGEENSFLDFYFFELKSNEQEKVKDLLEEEEKVYLEELGKKYEKGKLIFQLSEELLKIAVKLNETEGLFSTFYFTKNPVTLWGNYHKEYLIFTN